MHLVGTAPELLLFALSSWPMFVLTRSRYLPLCPCRNANDHTMMKQKSLMKFGVATDVVYWHEKLVAISAEIERETGEKLCSKVFVTFENEQSQRKCLKEMTTGKGKRVFVRMLVPGVLTEDPTFVVMYANKQRISLTGSQCSTLRGPFLRTLSSLIFSAVGRNDSDDMLQPRQAKYCT